MRHNNRTKIRFNNVNHVLCQPTNSPQLDELAELCGKTSQLIAGQVQSSEAGQHANVCGQSQQLVVVQVEGGQMLKFPQRRADIADAACKQMYGRINMIFFGIKCVIPTSNLQATPVRLLARSYVLLRQKDLLPPIGAVVFVFVTRHFIMIACSVYIEESYINICIR